MHRRERIRETVAQSRTDTEHAVLEASKHCWQEIQHFILPLTTY